MSYRTVLAALLMLSAFLNCGCEDVKESAQPAEQNTSMNISGADKQARAPSDGNRPAHNVIAYYFHRTYRCPSCLAIEAISLEALQTGFDQELQDGSLEWLTVNLDEPGGEEFVNNFNLVTSSLVIVDMHNEKQVRWKKLDKVWELKNDRDAFVKYVQDEAAAYLAGD